MQVGFLHACPLHSSKLKMYVQGSKFYQNLKDRESRLCNFVSYVMQGEHK
jgi:hypothetical protein